ncbi:MAG: hypothetical protein ACOX6M_03605 [Armatimonadota bacterium]|jgi:hypothetical protein|nr:hypothetical protein [candidate division WS1 bacterium]
MNPETRLGDALRGLARGATGSRTLARRLTTRQAATADELLRRLATDGPPGAVALTPGASRPGARYFMVGKDGLADEEVVLG